MKLDAISNPSPRERSYKTKSGHIPVKSKRKLGKAIKDLDYVLQVIPAEVGRVVPAVKDVTAAGNEYVQGLNDLNQ